MPGLFRFSIGHHTVLTGCERALFAPLWAAYPHGTFARSFESRSRIASRTSKVYDSRSAVGWGAGVLFSLQRRRQLLLSLPTDDPDCSMVDGLRRSSVSAAASVLKVPYNRRLRYHSALLRTSFDPSPHHIGRCEFSVDENAVRALTGSALINDAEQPIGVSGRPKDRSATHARIVDIVRRRRKLGEKRETVPRSSHSLGNDGDVRHRYAVANRAIGLVILERLWEANRVAMIDSVRRLRVVVDIYRQLADVGHVLWIDLPDGDVGRRIAELSGRLNESILHHEEAVEHGSHRVAFVVAAILEHFPVVLDDVLASNCVCPAVALDEGQCAVTQRFIRFGKPRPACPCDDILGNGKRSAVLNRVVVEMLGTGYSTITIQ